MLIEEFFKSFSHTWGFVSATGTWAAVIVALWLASSSRKPKLDIYITTTWSPASPGEKIKEQNAEGKEIIVSRHPVSGIGINIANSGSRPVVLSCKLADSSFSWGFPNWIVRMRNKKSKDGKHKGMRISQNKFDNISDDKIILEPGHSITLHMKDGLQTFLTRDVPLLCKENGLPSYMRTHINFYVITNDGHEFKARKSIDFTEELRSLRVHKVM